MCSAVPALRSAIAASSLPLRSAAVASRHLISSCSIAQSHSQFQYQYRSQTRSLSHLHPSEGAGQTLQAPNTSSTAADAVTAALGTSEPPVGASSESKAVGIEELRVKAKKLYKELHRLGRDYPDPEYGFNKRLRRAYEKNAKLTDPAALAKQLELAEHIKKGDS